MINVVYTVIVIGIIILNLSNLIRKINIHFNYIKHLFPDQLKNASKYFSINGYFATLSLDFLTLLWFWSPIYFKIDSYIKEDRIAYEYHLKLKDNRKRFVISFVFLILWLFVVKFVIVRFTAK